MKKERKRYMKLIEISENFYNDYKDAVFSQVPESVFSNAAAGLVGQGSECFGFDDEFSLDHDCEPGFQIYLTEKDYLDYGVVLQRAYNSLPNEYLSLKRLASSAGGSGRNGVFSVAAFYSSLIGCGGVPESLMSFLSVPDYALATAVNGKVFYDGGGEFSKIRDTLLLGYPQDVKLKKLASASVRAAQSGQYNFSRSVKRGDFGAASLCLNEFVQNAQSIIYLLNNAYKPYYKWSFKKMTELEILGDMKEPLEYLITEETSPNTSKLKSEIIEDISKAIIKEYKNQHITGVNHDYLEPHAFSINERINNAELKALHIMAG